MLPDTAGLLAWAQVVLAAATFLTSIALVVFTGVLARETKRMADHAGRPNVVATLEPNRWTLKHYDLRVANAGNAPAYDIEVEFDPPLLQGKARGTMDPPLQKIGVLRPGQDLSSYVAPYEVLQDINYRVVVSWRSVPDGIRQKLRYVISVADYSNVSQVGMDPLLQIATELKGLRAQHQQHLRDEDRRRGPR